MKRANKK